MSDVSLITDPDIATVAAVVDATNNLLKSGKIKNLTPSDVDSIIDEERTKEEESYKYGENLLYAQEHLNTNITEFTDCVYPKDRYVWSEYIVYVDTIGVDHFDVVLIDGRARTDCAYKILNYIDESSIVFIHDFWPRPEYHKVFDYYTEVVSIKDTQIGNGGQTIVGLKKNG